VKPPRVVLNDVTSTTWSNRLPVPDGRSLPRDPSALCLQNVGACQTATRRNPPTHFVAAPSWDPMDFDGRPLTVGGSPAGRLPPAWLFVKPGILGGSGDRLAMESASPAVGGHTVRVFRTEIQGSTDVWPMGVLVAVPSGHELPQPFSLLVYLQNTPQQEVGDFYRYFKAPFGWDWTFLQHWRWLNYSNLPLVHPWNAFGLAYQLARSGKNFILVVPQMPVAKVADDPRLHPLLAGSVMRQLLAVVRDVLFPAAFEGRFHSVALAAFSDGNNVLANFLTRNLGAGSSSADRAFVTDEVDEIFSFDPPQQSIFGNAVIQAALRWKATETTGRRKVVRVYSQHFYDPAYHSLLPAAKAAGLRAGVEFVGERRDRDVSLAYLPRRSDRPDVWVNTGTELHPRVLPAGTAPYDRRVASWENVHHWMPALFLVDAARRSPFI
jgi:hypothetical protein